MHGGRPGRVPGSGDWQAIRGVGLWGRENFLEAFLALDGPGCKATGARVDWRPCRRASGQRSVAKDLFRRSTLAGKCRWMNLYASPTLPARSSTPLPALSPHFCARMCD